MELGRPGMLPTCDGMLPILLCGGATGARLQCNCWAHRNRRPCDHCAVCDGFFYKGQEVAIVCGGDTAADEATYLANICSKVTMLVRRDVMRASKAMQHRVNSKRNIDLRYNTEFVEVLGDNVVEGIKVINIG